MADSNVLMPRDYIRRLLGAWQPDTGLVCSPPVGCRPVGFWAGLECAFLNTYQVRAQYVADALGLGFAQGKTMLWRRADLEAAGGIGALGAELAEDAASTKIVRAAGFRTAARPAGDDGGVAAANSLGATAPLKFSTLLRAGDR
jgi:ceramide glucosyltransferase